MSGRCETGLTNFNGLITLEKRRLLAEGEYVCTIKSWRTMFMYGGHKLIIDCHIPESYADLSYICNIQISNEGVVKNPGRRSRLYVLLKSMNRDNRDCFNLNDLIGMECFAQVVTSTKDDRKNAKPESEHYSIISTLLPIDSEESDFPF